MTSPKLNPIFRLMPSFADAAFLMPLVFLFTRLSGIRMLLGDGDTGWHVRTGEWILANHQVPREDIFSFTRPGQPWYAWEWLWDVVFAWLHQHGGLGLVVLVSLLVICSTFGMLFRLLDRSCGNPVVALGLTILAAAGTTIHWLARPHLFTMFFVVVWLSVIERSQQPGRTRLLFWLPVLTILWTNLHGGFLAGVLILLAYGAGELVRALIATGREERLQALRAAGPYFLAAVGSLAASLVNPYFYHLHEHIYEYLKDPYTAQHIVEFQGTNFQRPAAEFFEISLLLGFGAAIWCGARKRFGEIFMLAGWAHLSLMVVRNVPIFMLVAAPVTAVALVDWLKWLARAPIAAWLKKPGELLQEAAEEIGPIDRIWRTHLVCAFVFAVIFLGMRSPSAGKMLKPEYDPKVYPSQALALLGPSQRVFTHDEWGDYLIYNLWPKGSKVFVDGRSDFYGNKFNEQYISLMAVKYDWEQTLAEYNVDTVLLPPDAALASTIKESSRWRVVFDDGSAIVFRRAAGTGEQTSTRNFGGGGPGQPVAAPKCVVPKDHEIKQKGVSPL